jgi:hypothetical protein
LTTEGEERPWGPTQVTVPGNMDSFHSLILNDPIISTKKVNRDRGDILRNSRLYYSRDFRQEKALSQMSFKYLNAGQKRDRVLASEAILDIFHRDPAEFLNHLVTVDEIWIAICDQLEL